LPADFTFPEPCIVIHIRENDQQDAMYLQWRSSWKFQPTNISRQIREKDQQDAQFFSLIYSS